MPFLGDNAMERLRSAPAHLDFSGTRYSLQRFLARGGMGAVFLAEDTTLHRRVAIKILEVSDPSGTLSERLSKEAGILAQLEHPGIVPIHDSGTLADGRVYYVMKFVEGSRLDQFLAGIQSLSERLRLFLRVCDAVSFAHSRGILHRDIKPSNIMIGAFGEVLVMDWGLAKVLDTNSMRHSDATLSSVVAASDLSTAETNAATQEGAVLGTPGYMSPEQAAGKLSELTVRSDVFSLGKLLEFIVQQPTGHPAPRIPKPLRAIVAQASATDVADRYPGVPELAKDVSRFLDGAPVSAHRENPLERVWRFYKRYEIAILLIAMYLAMRTLFVLYRWR